MTSCSPHPRGWSPRRPHHHPTAGLLPAPAGMVPCRGCAPTSTPTAPRTRGDGPTAGLRVSRATSCSPHPRGWSSPRWCRWSARRLLPAPAGMVPAPEFLTIRERSAPRTRGDGPQRLHHMAKHRSCSPHPRGWSREHLRVAQDEQLLPAPAGMVPAAEVAAYRDKPAPRTRGDGPSMITWRGWSGCCSPHPRGWSPGDLVLLVRDVLLPAPAGMVPRRTCRRSTAGSAPRTRGDGPHDREGDRHQTSCSPHPRGWSPSRACGADGRGLLPAPAGMVPP